MVGWGWGGVGWVAGIVGGSWRVVGIVGGSWRVAGISCGVGRVVAGARSIDGPIGVTSVFFGEIGGADVVTGDAVFATTGNDNEKSTSRVPLITEGDASATDDDYCKKLCSYSATKNVKYDVVVDRVDVRV
ncbi:hypothetical protein QYF36_007273 [Acer negundo]|nr:hypothetical protein QYF36_007273 [Acer negundo]